MKLSDMLLDETFECDEEMLDMAANKAKKLEGENEGLRQWLLVILDCTDYIAGNCRVNEMIGAVLPKEIIEQARAALLTEQE